MRLVAPRELETQAAELGFVLVSSRSVSLPSAKALLVQRYRSQCQLDDPAGAMPET